MDIFVQPIWDSLFAPFAEFAFMRRALVATLALSLSAAPLGVFLTLRRMSLLGDAISHAMLPGIVIAVLAGARPGGIFVLVGAVAAGLLTVWLTQVLHAQGALAEDASAGVVFTTLFAIGVVMVTAAASRIDLDPSCVLYGILELLPFDTVSLAGWEIPRAFITATSVSALLSVAALLTWKTQVFVAFDAEAARAAGVPVGIVTTGLLAATTLATVAGFEAVGAILVVAMLVVPAAAAELLVHRLHQIAVLAVVLAARSPAALSVAALLNWAALQWLVATGRVAVTASGWQLLPRGKTEAAVVVRSHRLWEAWLGRHADLPVDHLHPPAEWVEHHLGALARMRIEADVGGQESDPHGREIPRER